MSSQWHLSRDGNQSGPYDLDQIRAMATAGEIRPQDLVWQEGMSAWEPAASIPGLYSDTAVTARREVSTSIRPVEDEHFPVPETRGMDWEDEEGDLSLIRRPALWNPGAAGSWSLLFTPIFGAYLHARNWRVLNNPGRATVNLAWVWLTVAFLVVNLALLFIHESKGIDLAMKCTGLALLLGWYFTIGKSQISFVHSELPGGYIKKSWGAPLGIGIAGWVFYLGMAVVLALSLPLSTDDLIAEVRPLILQEWRKQPGLGAPSIQNITLTHKGGNQYSGFVDARFDGVPVRYQLEIVVQGDSFTWQVMPLGQAPMK